MIEFTAQQCRGIPDAVSGWTKWARRAIAVPLPDARTGDGARRVVASYERAVSSEATWTVVVSEESRGPPVWIVDQSGRVVIEDQLAGSRLSRKPWLAEVYLVDCRLETAEGERDGRTVESVLLPGVEVVAAACSLGGEEMFPTQPPNRLLMRRCR